MDMDASGGVQAAPAFRRILVPLDGSPLAERALAPVEALAAAFGSEVILLRATRPAYEIAVQLTPIEVPPACNPNEIGEIEREQTSDYLESVRDKLEPKGWCVRTMQREGHPADMICAVAAEEHVDLIAITTHGRGGWRRVIFGSVATETIRRASCPVLVVHVKD
jgi:nucleotide-binding universal stress UspA family protein